MCKCNFDPYMVLVVVLRVRVMVPSSKTVLRDRFEHLRTTLQLTLPRIYS